MAYETTIKNALHHGVVTGVTLPGDGGPVPADVIARLHPKERAAAESMRGFRQSSFVGGRLAAQAALRGLGRSPSPVLSGPHGAPTGPKGLNVSISHKNNLAVALVARSELGSIGIDLEHLEPARRGVAERVLRPEELEAVRALPQERQWVATVLRFTIKEAIYKALAPRLVRYIGFDEASVAPGVNGDAEIRLFLKSGDSPAHIEARYIWLSTAVLATVRATWSPGTPATESP